MNRKCVVLGSGGERRAEFTIMEHLEIARATRFDGPALEASCLKVKLIF